MRGIVALCLLALLAGCGTKASVIRIKGMEPLPPNNGSLCVLPSVMPEGIEYTVIGRAAANQQGYGGFAGVNAKLIAASKAAGADVLINKTQRMHIGFFAWARPQSFATAAKLQHPESFNCVENGGTVDGVTVSTAAKPKDAKYYDACMARIMKISDPQQRLASMPMCDSAK